MTFDGHGGKFFRALGSNCLQPTPTAYCPAVLSWFSIKSAPVLCEGGIGMTLPVTRFWILAFIITVIFDSILPPGLYAQWSTSTLTQNALYVCPGFSPNIITFNDGSSIIAGGLTNDIFLGKLDERGYRIWPQPVLGHHNDSTNYPGVTARLIPDGGGGAIFVFPDNRGATPGPNGYYNNALYIQRVDGAGIVRWQNGGIQLAPACTGLKGAFPVTDGAGGGVFIVLERDFDHPSATNIERLWGARYDSNGTMLWRRMYDSSTVESSIQLLNVARVSDRVFVRTMGGTFVVDLNGNRLSISLPVEGSIAADRDSALFFALFLSERDTVNDSVYINIRITKYGSSFDTIWTRPLRALLDGAAVTGINVPFIPDRLGGLYYVRSSYDDIHSIRTRVYHLDSMGNNIWSIGQVFLPGFRTADAFHDGNGGIVLLLGFYRERAARFDYSGNSLWAGQPITVISDPENIGVTDGSAGDNRGGAIVPFWSFSGGIKAQHTGRNGVVGVITRVQEEASRLVSLKLHQNYPNPFNPSTKIGFQISAYGLVRLTVYDLLGRELETLVNEVKEPGSYSVQWDARSFASGVYYYRLYAGDNAPLARNMLLLR